MPKNILFYDTETTGLPDWKAPSESEHQPHIVQIGAILANSETRKVVSSIDIIIKPNGWEISQELTDIHGISQEMALDVGIDEKLALSVLLDLWSGCMRVAHNRTFDQRIIRIGSKRFLTDDQVEAWADKDSHQCTMLSSKPIMQMLPKNRYGFKSPKLIEAYKYFTGKDLENAHSAICDAQACMEIYWAIEDIGKDSVEITTGNQPEY